MPRFALLTSFLAALALAGQAHAFLGLAPVGTAIADYDPATGRISVSVNGVNNWFVQSATFSLTGDTPLGLPAGGVLVSDNDEIIGEVGFDLFGYTNLDLGNVAALGLPLSDLRISWTAGVGSMLETHPVSLWDNIPGDDPPPVNAPPIAFINGPITVNTLSGSLSTLLDASNSFDDGLDDPLSFKWDLDDDGIFEVNTGTTATLAIADVTSTFGGLGTYPYAVEVFDGEFSDIASSTLDIISQSVPDLPGPALPGSAKAQYDPTTGEIVVSVNGVNSWSVRDTDDSIMTGEEPLNLPTGGAFVSNTDESIGEAGFFEFTFTNLNLGNVAQSNLVDDGSLRIFWTPGIGTFSQSQPIVFATIGSIPEPTGLVLAALGLLGLGCRRRKRV